MFINSDGDIMTYIYNGQEVLKELEAISEESGVVIVLYSYFDSDVSDQLHWCSKNTFEKEFH